MGYTSNSIKNGSGRAVSPRRIKAMVNAAVWLLSFLTVPGLLWAQEEDNIGTETVTVVKPYSPTVSDAFKIQVAPTVNDTIELQKKPIEYVIYSVPVASTFRPAKAKASRVEKVPPPILYNSYAAVGLGNFNNALVDFYTSRELGRDEKLLDIALNHFSSRGDLDSTPLDTDFYTTDVSATLAKKDRDINWKMGLGLGHRSYNWYGLENGAFTDTQIASIAENQQYFNVDFQGQVELEDSFFKGAKILVRRFWDRLESAENRAVLSGNVAIPLTTEMLDLRGTLDYLGGEFNNASLNEANNGTGFAYGHLIGSITPALEVLKDELTLNLGAKFVYGNDLERKEGSFYIYPAITASYKIKEDKLIAYGGIEGDLDQNTYHGFAERNPYISPTLALSPADPLYGLYSLQPTDRQYHGYAGIKGQLSSNISYNTRAFYKAENRKPLFLLNPRNLSRDDEGGYTFGNSFQAFYDDVRTLGFFGELEMDINRSVTIGANAEFFNYSTETDNPAWNLPEIKASFFMDYQITEQWYAGAQLFYVGERQDRQTVASANASPDQFASNSVTLDGFFDANINFGYRFNDKLSVFAKISNLANMDYQRWANFRVQGFQALAGVSYKFDF